MRRLLKNSLIVLMCGVAVSLTISSASAQRRPGGPRPPGGRGPAAGGARPNAGERASEIKPYDEVITKKAVSKPGLLLTHQVDETLYFEILPEKFGKDMLWVTQIEQTESAWPSNVRRHRPVATSHSLIELPLVEYRTRCASGVKQTEESEYVDPSNVHKHSPLSTSQNLIVSSWPIDIAFRPSGATQIVRTGRSCALRVRTRCPVPKSQRRTLPS